MAPMRTYSISRKLTVMNMLVSGAALLLAGIAFFMYDLYAFQISIARNLSVEAQIIGSNTVSALLFNDPRSAENTLSALRASPRIVYAEIYTPDGRPFAGYWRDGSGAPLPLPPLPPGTTQAHRFDHGQIAVVSSIVFQGKRSGVVYIRSDLEAVYSRLKNYALIVASVLLLSLLAAWLVSRISQRGISEPLIHLAETARVVSREQNYSVREPPSGSRDEVATLIEAFNQMLTQIQLRDTALQRAHDELEERVRDRTAELERARHDLRVLSGRLLRAQDEERRRIARDLHDSSGQVLAALAMNLSIVEAEAARWNPKTRQVVTESIDLVQATLKELRTMSYLLHPPLLDEAGLESALRWFVEGFAERSQIEVRLQVAPEMGRLSTELETAIFRIVQEGLTNIHRHAASPRASISLARSAREVTLEIRDWGKGLKSHDGNTNPGTPGVGIQGMIERARQFGGHLEIQSESRGTTLLAVFPMAAK